MAHTYTSILVHCVFSTKDRSNLIREPERLWQYLTGVARGKGMATLAVGGTENHVHTLIVLPPTIALAKAVQELKGNSSKWMNEIGGGFAWQRGYGAFSISESGKDAVVAYVRGQAEHHRKWTFEQEYMSLLKKYLRWSSTRSMCLIESIAISRSVTEDAGDPRGRTSDADPRRCSLRPGVGSQRCSLPQGDGSRKPRPSGRGLEFQVVGSAVGTAGTFRTSFQIRVRVASHKRGNEPVVPMALRVPIHAFPALKRGLPTAAR